MLSCGASLFGGMSIPIAGVSRQIISKVRVFCLRDCVFLKYAKQKRKKRGILRGSETPGRLCTIS